MPTCRALPHLVAPQHCLVSDADSHAVRLASKPGSNANAAATHVLEADEHAADDVVASLAQHKAAGSSAHHTSDAAAECADTGMAGSSEAHEDHTREQSLPDAAAAGASNDQGGTQPASLGVPWQFLSGATNEPLLQSLTWQLKALLAQRPGAPEAAIAEQMRHALAPAHVRMLLQHMQSKGMVACVHMPERLPSGAAQHGDAASSSNDALVATDAGLVPAMFANPVRTVPVAAHYFVSPTAQVCAEAV